MTYDEVVQMLENNEPFYAVFCRTASKGVTKVENYVAYDCTDLISMVLPSGIKEIGEQVMESCDTVNFFTIPEGVVSIDRSMLQSSSALSSIVLPKSLTTVGTSIFNARSLAFCKTYASVPPVLSNDLFHLHPDDFVIYVPKGSLQAYQTADGWSSYADIMQEFEE